MGENNRKFVQRGEEITEQNPWTNNAWLCRPDLVAAEKLLLVRATMRPFHCHPFHYHPHREEIIYVLEGRAEQWVGDEYRILGPGEIAHLPSGVVHGTYNPFNEPLVFQAILAPAILPENLAAAADPVDVSDTDPWTSLRAGRPDCRVLENA